MTGGGIWYHSGAGVARLDAPEETDAAAEGAAWDAYLTHVRGCAECHTRLHNCEAGAALWAAYTAARGPLTHPAAWAGS